jgi:hypothetical protein
MEAQEVQYGRRNGDAKDHIRDTKAIHCSSGIGGSHKYHNRARC